MVWSGAGISCSQDIPPDFYPSYINVGPPVPPLLHDTLHLFTPLHAPTSLPLLHIWMNVASLNPWLLDFRTAQFSDESGSYLFSSLVVIFAVVVQGGEPYLPMPPS